MTSENVTNQGRTGEVKYKSLETNASSEVSLQLG